MQIPIIIGEDPTIRRTAALAQRLAATVHPIFIAGEPGTGREHVARFLHARGPRAVAPLSILDCGAAVRGAFDDELARAFRSAARGTLLIRDCDLLDAEGAAAIATALGDLAAPRIVMTASSTADAVAATPLLGDRLGALTLYLPPLRIRRADIPALVAHFKDAWCCEYGAPAASFSAAAMVGLWRHQWPGNLRELRSEVHAALDRCGDGAVDAIHLPPHFFPGPRRAEVRVSSGGGASIIPQRRRATALFV